MSAKGTNIVNTLNTISEKMNRPLFIVETGTIRDVRYDEGDGHSTKHIADWIKDKGGYFVTIDVNCAVAIDYLAEYTNIVFLQGHSFSFLPLLTKVDFVYLDSANDATNCLTEFLMIWDKVNNGGAVLVDDCALNSPDLHKGDSLIPYLMAKQMEFELIAPAQLRIWKR